MKNHYANSLLLQDDSSILIDTNESIVKHLNQSGHCVLNQLKLRSKILFMFLINQSELLVFCHPNIVHRFIVFLPHLNQSTLKLKKSFRLQSIDSLVGGCRTDDSHFLVFTNSCVHYYLIGLQVTVMINHYSLKNQMLSIKCVDYFHNLDQFGQLNAVIATENYLIQWNSLTNQTTFAQQKKIKWLKVVRYSIFPIIVTETNENVTVWTSGFRFSSNHCKINFTTHDPIFASPNFLFYFTKQKDLVVHRISQTSFTDLNQHEVVLSASQMRNFSNISSIQNGIVVRRKNYDPQSITDTEYERLIYYSQVESLVQLCIRSLTYSKKMQRLLTTDLSILPQDVLILLNESISLKKNPFYNELKEIE